MINNLFLDFAPSFQLILSHNDQFDKWTGLHKVLKKIVFNGEEYNLGTEVLDSILSDLSSSCKNIMENSLELHPHFKNIGIAFYYNLYCYSVSLDSSITKALPFLDSDLSINNHMTEGNGFMIYCYTVGNSAYIEFGRIYQNFANSNTQDFKEWLKNYRSIGLIPISINKIVEVNNRIDSLLMNGRPH